jgi:hypothetical protein
MNALPALLIASSSLVPRLVTVSSTAAANLATNSASSDLDPGGGELGEELPPESVSAFGSNVSSTLSHLEKGLLLGSAWGWAPQK